MRMIGIKMKKSCIIVLYYNKINLTKTCIESILNSGYEPEIILAFDNGSQIDNFNFIKKTFPGVRHKRTDDNKGYSGGFNGSVRWAIEEGFSDFLFCTNDTALNPETLNNCLMYSEKHNTEFIAPKVVYSDNPSQIDSIGGYFDYSVYSLKHYKDENLPLFLSAKNDYVPGTAFWLTKDVFNKLNGMNESYNTYWEDADFSFRAHDAGIKIIRCSDALVSHGVGKTCHKKPLYSAYYFQRNRIRFCEKYCTAEELKNAKNIIHKDLKNYESKWIEKNDKTRLSYLNELFKELDRL